MTHQCYDQTLLPLWGPEGMPPSRNLQPLRLLLRPIVTKNEEALQFVITLQLLPGLSPSK